MVDTTKLMANKNKKKFAWHRYLIGAVFCLLLLFPLWLVVKASSSAAVVLEVPALDSEASVHAKTLARRLIDKVLSDAPIEIFSATEAELNSLVSLLMRGLPRLTGRVNVTSWGLEAAFALHVPENPFGDYLNIRFGLVPSNDGLQLINVAIGTLNVSGDLALMIGRQVLDLLLSNRQGTLLLNSVREVAMQGSKVTVTFSPVPDLKKRLGVATERFRKVRDDLALLGEPAIVRLYFERICEIDALHVGNLKMSLAWYTAPVFSLAVDRVRKGGDAGTENQAALLALGIYFGDTRIESLVGKVRTGRLQDCHTNPRHVVLADRVDLRLHFIISAVLKVISDSGMSSAVGEFKELLDAGRGGSGFSFVDLAADQAGIRLAGQLLEKGEAGRRVQQVLANSTAEDVFFPFIGDLPEGLANAQFVRDYGGVDDPRYQAMLTDIGNRLDVLPVYMRSRR